LLRLQVSFFRNTSTRESRRHFVLIRGFLNWGWRNEWQGRKWRK
jgi:hypothetical protein